MTTIYTDLSEAKQKFLHDLEDYTKRALKKLRYKGEYGYVMCISDRQNFRKLVLPTYKSGRTKRKPCGYKFLKEWAQQEYKCVTFPYLEADDVIGVLSGTFENCCILSGDKDMLTINKGYLYDFIRDEIYELTEEQGKYKWFYQTLIGDSTDGYTGIPGCGPKTAEKILNADCSWKSVVKAYESKGLTEEDALVQARVARILHAEDYNMDTGVIRLWHYEEDKRELLCPNVVPISD